MSIECRRLLVIQESRKLVYGSRISIRSRKHIADKMIEVLKRSGGKQGTMRRRSVITKEDKFCVARIFEWYVEIHRMMDSIQNLKC